MDENVCDVCECQGQFCGGIAGFQCPEGQVCEFEGDYPDAGETCVIHVTQVGLQHACVTIPDACDGEASCDCMGDAVCTGVFDSCGTGENNDLYCSCPVC